MIAKRIVINGMVQRVGFRDWLLVQAGELGISGWVRNQPDGSVLALIAGDTPMVEELLRRCRRGPRLSQVTEIIEEVAELPEQVGFFRAG